MDLINKTIKYFFFQIIFKHLHINIKLKKKSKNTNDFETI